MASGTFVHRHLGPREEEQANMLAVTGHDSMEALIARTVPQAILSDKPMALPEGVTESAYLDHIDKVAAKNMVFRNYIGMGYHPTEVPSVIRRNVLENPGWYTAYTPYQAEIAQGRLEALLNFQTMVCELTGMEMANASLLDEATAAAEAMTMLFNSRSRKAANSGVNRFVVSDGVFPQTWAVLHSRAVHLGIDIEQRPDSDLDLDDSTFGLFLQYPDDRGRVEPLKDTIARAHEREIRVVVATDLLACALVQSPGSMGADVVVGNSQRFGVPMGYGGPHAAFFATRLEFKRNVPGRVIGASVDRLGNLAYRMALQTREQHIRRDKATSNICTAQSLLAVMASMYAVYHGPQGLRAIAQRIHGLATALGEAGRQAGVSPIFEQFFDTVVFAMDDIGAVMERANRKQINLRYFPDGVHVGVSFHECTLSGDFTDLCEVLGFHAVPAPDQVSSSLAEQMRPVDYLHHPVFNSHRSETAMMRYLKHLENKDLSLTHSMIPLGSCTMKLNAATQLLPIGWSAFAQLHPFCPPEQAAGTRGMIAELEQYLCEITGFSGMSLQPNSGAQGEYTGLLVIRAYHASRGESYRDVCLIPSSAHGTNPASAVMCGMKVVVVGCDKHGNINLDELKEKAAEHADSLAALMITYPSTHGVFEKHILEVTETVHANGGQIYMDGANMNAQVGLTNPGRIGADVCHLNLHKTFAIPHGGGGPGVGPIGVAEHLVPFLPGHVLDSVGGEKAIRAVSAAPFGSALIHLISYAYIRLLGPKGLKKSTEVAILNANYLRARLEGHYDVLYKGKSGNVAHEMIIDCRSFKASAGVEVTDIAKRLIDYGFHAPTVSWPVAGTLMIEPTESESLDELDRFVEAMVSIREEIRAIESGRFDREDNPVLMAPHTAAELTASEWHHPYSREEAAYPVPVMRERKFWPSVARVDNAHGDRNLVCTCPSVELYTEPLGV
ncbi:MAG: glycine dehydrogenase (aminomethyl-transferring) [Crocinitomicaceae bacterium]|nr:glycine dehydrogenase (aminomethyl-transferring) [Crocinitomicaceae bacterium]